MAAGSAQLINEVVRPGQLRRPRGIGYIHSETARDGYALDLTWYATTGWWDTFYVDTMKTEHVCPKCQSKKIDRAPRQDILERLILMLRRKRLYRCLDCDHRFHDRPVSKQ